MLTLTLAMAGLGAVEAVVHLWRYRSANGSGAWSSALAAGAVQTLRVSGIGGVAAAVDSGAWLAPAAAYVASPVLVTAAAHAQLERRDRRRAGRCPGITGKRGD